MNITGVSGINFTGISRFEDFNPKYEPLRSGLEQKLDSFIKEENSGKIYSEYRIGHGIDGNWNVFGLGELPSEADINKPAFVIKRNKLKNSDDYERVYRILSSLSSSKIAGPDAVARAYNNGNYYLITTYVPEINQSSGKSNNIMAHFRDLFSSLFELDKRGIFHGDLNPDNIVIQPNGKVGFFDYKWARIVEKVNAFDGKKIQKCLMPKSMFIENAQMFEMASIPKYLKELNPQWGEYFIREYLSAKSEYHQNRYEFLKKYTKNWRNKEEKNIVAQSLAMEKAKAEVYKNPSEAVLKIEEKKFQFLSDFRDAYTRVDANIPNRNILNAPSAYLCSISAVQDFRKAVDNQLSSSGSEQEKLYLKSMEEYGKYWYDNLTSYTRGTFDYIYRLITGNLNYGECGHDFYENKRSPEEFLPNTDLSEFLTSKFKPKYEQNFAYDWVYSDSFMSAYWHEGASEVFHKGMNLPYHLKYECMYFADRIPNFYQSIKESVTADRPLESLNYSELLTLKVKEFMDILKEAYEKEYRNCSTLAGDCYDSSESLFIRVKNYTLDLFNSVFNNLKAENPKDIVVRGYEGMRKFR